MLLKVEDPIGEVGQNIARFGEVVGLGAVKIEWCPGPRPLCPANLTRLLLA